MAVFSGREQVFRTEGLSLGEFDPSADGFYRNVKTFSFKVKKRRTISISITSGIPVDIVVANEKGATVSYKPGVKEGTIGPIPTDDNKEMTLVLGVYPGDKTAVNAEVWMDRP